MVSDTICYSGVVSGRGALGEPHPAVAHGDVDGDGADHRHALGVDGERCVDGLDRDRERPVVDPGFLSDPADLALQAAGVRYAREVLAARPMRDLIDREILPGPDVTSEEAIRAHCRRTVKTNWHPCGTCRMGRTDDPDAVVTADLKVRGIEGLRVFDASVMPSVPHANTNAPTMALADRGVDIMTGAVSLRSSR